MNRRTLAVLVALGATVVASVALVAVRSGQPGSPTSGQSGRPASGQAYPAGAGPDHVDFSALRADDANVSHAPREHWDSFAIIYTAPPERRLVEGDYYINSATGEIIADRWNDARVYRNGSTYAFVQPTDGIRNERRRQEFDSDPAFVYHEQTDAYYRYDPYYGRLAPTNIGRHTQLLDAYTWTATGTTTHHGVEVITYRLTGRRTDDARAPPAVNGTLRLGVEDGIVYSYDVTLEGDHRYTYVVKPAPFPDHGWVATARDVAANASDGGR